VSHVDRLRFVPRQSDQFLNFCRVEHGGSPLLSFLILCAHRSLLSSPFSSRRSSFEGWAFCGLVANTFEARREALSRLIAGADGVFSEALAAEGAVVFAKVGELGLEGIVSKRESSFYRSGKSRNWLKTKNPNFVRT
jgi:hypothetical protein